MDLVMDLVMDLGDLDPEKDSGLDLHQNVIHFHLMQLAHNLVYVYEPHVYRSSSPSLMTLPTRTSAT